MSQILNKPTVEDVVEAIRQLDSSERKELLNVLPSALLLDPENSGWLRSAESSFNFWDNEEDAVYDRL